MVYNFPTDEQIQEAVKQELQSHVLTMNLNIEVTVRKGIVTLKGHVPTLAHAEAAEDIVACVDGVVRIYDKLEFNPT